MTVIPNWCQGAAYPAARKFPCHQYKIRRVDKNTSIISWIEYFDCFGVLQKAEVPAPTITQDETIIYVCSWSYVEGNQDPLPPGLDLPVLEVEQLDGCYESYYQSPTGGIILPPTSWPDPSTPPPTIPWTPAQPVRRPPGTSECPNGMVFFREFSYLSDGGSSHWSSDQQTSMDNKRYFLEIPAGRGVEVMITSVFGGATAWGSGGNGPGLPVWGDVSFYNLGDSSMENFRTDVVGETNYQGVLDGIITTEYNAPENLDDYAISGGSNAAMYFHGGANGARVYIDIHSPIGPGQAIHSNNYQSIEVRCMG